jgi:hypothetical protein
VVAILPLIMLIGEDHMPLRENIQEVKQTIVVNAAPETIWDEILTAKSIRPEELPFSFAHFISVPKPVEGINLETPKGEVRYSVWEKGVNFRGIVTDRKDYEFISWHYDFDSHSFPEGSMDEHVEIGGRYFNLQDTTFNLQSLPNGKTLLEIVAHYRVTSSVNFYAVPAAKFLGHDFINTILTLYKGRSEIAESKGR